MARDVSPMPFRPAAVTDHLGDEIGLGNDRRRSRSAVQQRDLAEELAGFERRHRTATDVDVCSASEQHDEVAALALSSEDLPPGERNLRGRARDELELLGRAR